MPSVAGGDKACYCVGEAALIILSIVNKGDKLNNFKSNRKVLTLSL